MSSDINISQASDSGEDVKLPNQEPEPLVCDSYDEAKVEEPAFSNNNEKEVAETNEVLIGMPLAEMQSNCSPCQPSASESSRCSDIQNITESSLKQGFSNKSHSTSVDPNFVETYFKNSRLHFIGTWRNRYRKRFPSSSDGFKPSSSISASSTCQRNTVIHVDMDCFFVSVVIRNRPELWDKPVAVCHSDNPRGTSEISSANYPARDHGVRAGIFVRDAKALCPHLVIIPYDFEAYEEVADQFYSILHKHCNKVQAMSCDEAILDVSDSEVDDRELLASLIRKEIFATTGCTASAGISGNMLMARLATRSAKPNNQCYLPPEKVSDFLKDLPIKALPGIGRALEEKLKGRHVKTCGELRMISKESLQKDFGQKTGDMLWSYCRGIDNRLVGMIQESKSVGADVNWGVRFKDLKDSQHFLLSLCKEVSLRLHGCGVRGRTITLKVKKRKTDEEPIKYMGCGDCDNLSHSLTVPMATDDVEVLQRITKQLFSHFHIDVKDVRGIGLHVTKLESADNYKQGSERSSIRSWLASGRERSEVSIPSTKEENEDIKEQIGDHLHQSRNDSSCGGNLSVREANCSSDIPLLSELDSEVLESLPPDILSEMNDLYGGKLKEFIKKQKFEDVGTSSILAGNDEVENGASTSRNAGVMPSSLSQIDASVLQQLPEEIRDDLLGHLPAHRNLETCLRPCPEGLGVEAKPRDDKQQLWVGNPPEWVEKLKYSNCEILRFFSETYTCNLSSVLLKSFSVAVAEGEGGCIGEYDDEISELLKQYIDLKVESDLEEIHTCYRLLRRLSGKSELLLKAYNTTLPHLQLSVSEKFGGSLDI